MEEIKISPKFTTTLLSGELPDDPQLENLKHWCREFAKSGLMPCYDGGSFGNLSFRTNDNEFIITASGMKDLYKPESFVKVSKVDMKEKIVYGHGKNQPSSESMLHFKIYRERKDVNAVFHGHCELMLQNLDKLNVPCTKKEEPYGTMELVDGVMGILGKHNFVIMKGHGFLALGRNMDEAGKLAIKVLESIKK
jgi:ribulose-5-phosphate 4-epimerase/fuculose-1-phosphate aldolase